MQSESVTLVTPNDQTSMGIADIRRISPAARKFWSTFVLVAGIVLGAVSILIPLLHFFSTWILPLTGYILSCKIRDRAFSISWLKGTCPACGKEFELGGRQIPNSEWQWCPHCEAKMRVIPRA